ncbi:hypothetical protein PC112_g9524 [Phytophthora cactorum]|nr:hypothetical protein PC112_g9524 [Phytophthora cactorum]KAG3086377.1 hypothetical protein PC122_g9259 [Phytophthora cactorum]
MEAPRRQNHYIVKQRWEALNIPLGTLKGGEKSQRCCSSTRGPRRAELQRYLCTGGMIEYMQMEQGAGSRELG